MLKMLCSCTFIDFQICYLLFFLYLVCRTQSVIVTAPLKRYFAKSVASHLLEEEECRAKDTGTPYTSWTVHTVCFASVSCKSLVWWMKFLWLYWVNVSQGVD